jgi:hypothetical protein
MKELAETADRVLPKDDDGCGGRGGPRSRGGGGGGRGGRPKKEKTLKEALHESWNGKVWLALPCRAAWGDATWAGRAPACAFGATNSRQRQRQPCCQTLPQSSRLAEHPLTPPSPALPRLQDYLGRLQEFAKLQAVAEGADGPSPLGVGPGGEPEFKPVFVGGSLTPAREHLAALGAAASRRDSGGEAGDSASDGACGGSAGGDEQQQEPKRRRATRHMGAGRPMLDLQPELSFLDSPEPAPKVSAAQRKRRMTTAAPPAPAMPASPPPAGLQARLARARRATLAPGALSRMAAADLETPGPKAAPAAAPTAPLSAPRSQERPPWNGDTGKASAGPGAAPPTGATAGGTGARSSGGNATGAAERSGNATGAAERSDRAAVARLQAQLEGRSEEVAALQQQLKDAEVLNGAPAAGGADACC